MTDTPRGSGWRRALRGLFRVLILLGIAFVVLVGVGFVITFFGMYLLQAVFLVGFGFISYTASIVGSVRPGASAVLQFVVLLALLAVATHLLVRTTVGRMSPPRQWRLLDTVAVLGLLLMLFVAGMALGGIGHQIGWLARAEQPLTRSSWDTLRMEGQHICRRLRSASAPNPEPVALRLPIPGDEPFYLVPIERTEGGARTVLIFPREPEELAREGGLLCHAAKDWEFITAEAVAARLTALRSDQSVKR